MKILAPFKEISTINKFISAGADEFYIGFHDNEWEKKFGQFSHVNEMTPLKGYANVEGIDSACKIIELIKANNKSVFLTFNARVYSISQLEYIQKKYIDKLKSAGVDGIIASGIDLVKLLKENKIECVLSTLSGVYNSDILNIYRKLGVKRVILPRDLLLTEIKQIVLNNKDIDFEVFMMRNRCRFSESSCVSTHAVNDIGGICHSVECKIKSQYYISKKIDENKVNLNEFLYNGLYMHREACALCSLFEFKELGIKALKIVGRPDSPDEIINVVKMIQKNLEILQNCNTKEEYFEKICIPKIDMHRCSKGFGCYYPESRYQ